MDNNFVDIPTVPIDAMEGPLRAHTQLVNSLGGDTTFYQFAANAPHVADFYWGNFYNGLFFQGVLPIRVKEMIRLRLASFSGCGFCAIGDRVSASKNGMTDEEITAVIDVSRVSHATFNERELVAIQAIDELMGSGNVSSNGSVLSNLLSVFSPSEAVEFMIVSGVLLGVGRVLSATNFISQACSIDAPGVVQIAGVD